MENTVKIYMLGAAAVVVSGVKLEDWKRAEKYAPEALRFESGDESPDFRIRTDSGTGSMTDEGVVWGNYPNPDGYATITILLDEEVEDKAEAVRDVVGKALLKLIEVEKGMPELLANIAEKEKEIDTHIIRI